MKQKFHRNIFLCITIYRNRSSKNKEPEVYRDFSVVRERRKETNLFPARLMSDSPAWRGKIATAFLNFRRRRREPHGFRRNRAGRAKRRFLRCRRFRRGSFHFPTERAPICPTRR